MPRDTLHKLRRQAALQLVRAPAPASRSTSCLPYQDGYGFGLLPQPAPGDLFFDIEGDPYIGDKGLEYLFGVGWLADDGSEAFQPFWAHDRAQERRSFEAAGRLLHGAGWPRTRAATSTTTQPTRSRR